MCFALEILYNKCLLGATHPAEVLEDKEEEEEMYVGVKLIDAEHPLQEMFYLRENTHTPACLILKLDEIFSVVSVIIDGTFPHFHSCFLQSRTVWVL